MAFAKGNKYGNKTPKYTDPEVFRQKIDEYFEECKGKLLADHNGDPVIDRWGDPVMLGKKPPTLSGLAYALGFKTRTGLNRYKAKKEFMELLLDAKLRIEMYNEEQLYTRDGSKGAMFNLRMNFEGWQEEKQDEGKGPAVAIINDIPHGTVNLNTDTAVFNPLQKPDEDAAGDAKE